MVGKEEYFPNTKATEIIDTANPLTDEIIFILKKYVFLEFAKTLPFNLSRDKKGAIHFACPFVV